MFQRHSLHSPAFILVAGFLIGCQQPAHDIPPPQGPPPRPAELDKLNAWVGAWNATGEMTVYTPKGPQSTKVTAAEHWTWACADRFLLSNFEWNMGGDDAQKSRGVVLMTWDPKEKEYHSWEFMSNGTVNYGEMEHDEKTGIWRMEGKGTDPMTGKPSRGEGTARMVDDKTIEWSFTMWDGWRLKKLMEGKGTSKKQ